MHRQYSVPEAAAVLGLSPGEINNALDRELSLLGVATLGQGDRKISAKGLLALELLRSLSELLTPKFRRGLIRHVLEVSDGETSIIAKGCVMVDITEHKAKVALAEAKLTEAEALVVSDPEVLMGEPCIVGTRVPVYMIAVLVGEHGIDEAHATYPFLTFRQIELSMIYATANPRRGRPKMTTLPEPKEPARRGTAKRVRTVNAT
jgi:uncharacterized protein (DUF433 family)